MLFEVRFYIRHNPRYTRSPHHTTQLQAASPEQAIGRARKETRFTKEKYRAEAVLVKEPGSTCDNCGLEIPPPVPRQKTPNCPLWCHQCLLDWFAWRWESNEGEMDYA